MPLQSGVKLNPMPQASIARTINRTSSDKEHRSMTKNSQGTVEGPKEIEEAKALAHSVTRRRLKYLIPERDVVIRKPKKPHPLLSSRRINKQRFLLMDLPVDIFYEVARNLSPCDLLQLLRTSKTLRSVLLSKPSRSIWRAARNEVGLPDCPEDLSEPAYASLLFDKECQACGSFVKKPDFFLRLRLCSDCYFTNVIQGHKFIGNVVLESSVRNDVFRSLPSDSRHAEHVLNSEYGVEPDELRFFKGDLFPIWQVSQSFKNKPLQWQAFTEERKVIVRVMAKACKDIEAWTMATDRMKQSNNKRLKEKREQTVTEKLVDLGYDVDDILQASKVYKLEWKKLVLQPVVLTERSWWLIGPKLETFLQDVKKKREYLERLINRKTSVYVCYCIYLTAKLPESIYYYGTNTAQAIKASFAPNKCELEQWNAIKDDLNLTHFWGTPAFITFKDFLKLPTITSFINEDCETGTMFNELRQLFLVLRNEILVGRQSTLSQFTEAATIGHRWMLQSDETCGISLSPTLKDVVNRALTCAQYLTLGPAALFSSDRLKFASLDPASFMSHWTELAASASPEDRRLQSPDIADLLCHPSTIATAYLLLLSLGMERPEAANIYVLKELGEVFVCMKCHAVGRTRMSWQDIVKHFIAERSITLAGQKLVKCGVLSAAFLDDHDFTGMLVAFDLSESSLYPTLQQRKSLTDYSTRLHCSLCTRAFRRVRLMSELEAEVHAPMKHEKVYSRDDFCVHKNCQLNA